MAMVESQGALERAGGMGVHGEGSGGGGYEARSESRFTQPAGTLSVSERLLFFPPSFLFFSLAVVRRAEPEPHTSTAVTHSRAAGG